MARRTCTLVAMGAGERHTPATDAPAGAQAPPGMRGACRIDEREERYGPLAVERYAKDDGRALLLYRHAGERRP